MPGGWVYIMTNRRHGTLYVGVTDDLPARGTAHRDGRGSAFVRRYNLIRLVYAEPFPSMEAAITREKALKRWRRAWKCQLIDEANPEWIDLLGGEES